ncbi:Acg family FMN-binding oxidoreductase [Nocardia carnea]|uniref:Acg family FMN-binding oxidoreductase n=1 Tax=Nocardia carnea TaxID=37328 RepID=UPI002453F3EA|nr:hypothetical protein [Nocardia carnea]
MDAIGTARVPDHPTVQAALALARRAPSVHNTQPWRVVFDGHRLQLYSDTCRRLSSADPQGRQLIISCGALLDHIRTAFAAAGWSTRVTRLPDTAADHLAEVEFEPARDVSDTVRARAAAIDRRYTDRLPMLPPRDWARVEPALRAAAAACAIDVTALDASARLRLAAASAQSAALRAYDPQYLNELHWWAGNDSPADGVPISALVSAAELAQVGVGRAFPAPPPPQRRRGPLSIRRLLPGGRGAVAPRGARPGTPRGGGGAGPPRPRRPRCGAANSPMPHNCWCWVRTRIRPPSGCGAAKPCPRCCSNARPRGWPPAR